MHSKSWKGYSTIAESSDGASAQTPMDLDHPVPSAEHPAEIRLHEAEERLHQWEESAKRTADKVNRRAGRNLGAAIAVALLLVGVAVVCLIWWMWGFALLVAAGLIGCQFELTRAVRDHAGADVPFVPVAVGTAVTLVGSYATRVLDTPWSAGTFIMASLSLTIVAVLTTRLTKPVAGYLRDVSAATLLVCYLTILGVSLMSMAAEDDGTGRILLFILAVAASDTGGYFAGLLFGKHPMAPTISPKKTWEGVAGSVIVSCALGAAVTVWVLGAPAWKGIVISVVILVCGILGDLVESVMKRDLGIKDMGNSIPGHGGFLDRFDSYIVAAPVAWIAMAALL
ncbi:MAG: phosphatidate cytidylyltransferase [Propionibacteriaceae bacterium]|nr:phosphatidate cytidylyltransferase [Propionibacteriaceae bacterium]